MPRSHAIPDVVVTHEGGGDGGAVTEMFAIPQEPTPIQIEEGYFDDLARERLVAFEQDCLRRTTETHKEIVLLDDSVPVQRRTHSDVKRMVDDVISAPWGTSMYGKDVDAAEVTLPDGRATT